MANIFLEIVNMSITASWIVLAVLILRLLLKKAPKWVNVILWGIVGIRLVLPFSLESIFSLIPSAQTVSPDIMTDTTPQIHSGIPSFNNMVNPTIESTFAPTPGDSANPLQIWIPILAIVWLTGIALLVLYSIISYWRLRKKVATAVLLKDNIYQSENVESPFMLGIINPKIYLPFAIGEQDREQVIAHEKAHIQRKDYLWKPLGFFLLTLHWFNPFMWVAYQFLSRDIELACDEKVIKNWDDTQKADYSQALLNCSVHRKMIAACPLAFGEVSVKNRVKSVLNYKKPAFWIVVVAVVVSIAVGVCFLTNPATVKLQDIEGFAIQERLPESTNIMFRNGDSYDSIGPVDKERLQPLLTLKISSKAISNDRSTQRDDTYTLILHLPNENPLASFVPGIGIHFNKDFSAVWVHDSNSQGLYTLSYQVKNPQKAKEVYFALAENNGTISTVGGADEPESAVTSVPGVESTPSQQEEATSSKEESSKVSKPKQENSKPAPSKVPVASSQPTPSEDTSSAYKPTRFDPLTQAKIKEISACVEKDNYEYGENQYFGTYNGYDVLLISQIDGVETADAQPLKIAGYEFVLGKTEKLIAYKDHTYISLSQAYANGVVTKQEMENIHYLYRYDFDYLIDGSRLIVSLAIQADAPEKEYTQEDFPGIAIKNIEKQTWSFGYEDKPCDYVIITLPFENRRNVMNVVKKIEKMDGVFFAEPDGVEYPC